MHISVISSLLGVDRTLKRFAHEICAVQQQEADEGTVLGMRVVVQLAPGDLHDVVAVTVMDMTGAAIRVLCSSCAGSSMRVIRLRM